MITILPDELIPAANSFDTEHLPIAGVLAGMGVMALILWMLP